MEKNYLLKEKEGRFFYSPAKFFRKTDDIKTINHPIRKKILELLSKKPMYPIEIAKKLGIHEQNVYYHLNLLIKSDILKVIEKKEIRGTTAKKYAPKFMNFALGLSEKWKKLYSLKKETNKELLKFLYPFIKNNEFNAKIVVGSPDPHGPHKARARDGHYAIDLAMFLGRFCEYTPDFSVSLDVDINLKKEDSNLVIVGGPVTNLILNKINEKLNVKFSYEKEWALINKKKRTKYTEDSCGIIARIPHPYFPDKEILILAGIRFNGTKASVIALTRFSKLFLKRFYNQENFYTIIQGFDLDGDGKIDSVEVME